MHEPRRWRNMQCIYAIYKAAPLPTKATIRIWRHRVKRDFVPLSRPGAKTGAARSLASVFSALPDQPTYCTSSVDTVQLGNLHCPFARASRDHIMLAVIVVS